jgi:peroxiredoxin
MLRTSWAFGVLALSLAGPASAAAPAVMRGDGPQVGDAAPPVTAKEWLNGAAPELAGKPVMVEFWGTWCGPCVAAMPHVQDVWARYREQGLVVAAISFEAPAVLQPFLEKKGYTLPIGSDPERTCIGAFGVESWPTTFVIDREGKLIYRGGPMGVEPFVQQALGLETSPPALLLRALAGGEGAAAALQQLAREAPRAFDLGSWARGQGGAPAARAPKDADAALSALATDWAGPRREQRLADVAAAVAAFDLRAWAARELAERFPIPDEELAKLVAEERYGDVVQAIVARRPSKKALAALKSEDGLRDYCNERAAQRRENGTFLVLIGHWHFGEYESPAETHFPQATGMLTERDGVKGFFGVALNSGETYEVEDFPACIEPYLASVLVVEALAKRKLPDDVGKGAAKLHGQLVDDLKSQHGSKKAKPKPPAGPASEPEPGAK